MLEASLRGRRVLVDENVVEIFQRHKQVGEDAPEAGGILMGQVTVQGDVVLVCRASVPGPFDRAGRYEFIRDQIWANAISRYEFLNSGGLNVYLGEWHTHPARRAEPSPRDRRMIAEQYSGNLLVTDFLLLAVVGLEEIYLGVFDGKRLTHKLLAFP